MTRELSRWTVLFAVAAAVATSVSAETFDVDQDRSLARVHVFKKGLLKGAAHDHEFDCDQYSGRIEADWADLSAGHVELVFQAGQLTEMNLDLSEDDREEVEETTRGEKVLDVENHPEIRFLTTEVLVSSQDDSTAELTLTGQLTIRETTNTVRFPVQLFREGSSLRASGSVALIQSDFGIKPYKAFLGTIGVKDEIRFDFDIVASQTGAAGPEDNPSPVGSEQEDSK